VSGRRKAKAAAPKPAREPKPAVVIPRRVRAKYDAAQTTADNRKHWAMADALSADAAASPGVRRILRNRSRYEVANNSYARGIVSTLANDAVGTCVRVRMLGLPRADASRVEGAFSAWAEAIDLAEKLRTLRAARAVDGEGFALLIANDGIPADVQVRLDLRLIEAEQVASPGVLALEPNQVDGIRFDQHGNPVQYEVLREHPGSGLGAFGQSMLVPADQVLHYFLAERPGQRRGIPELTPALALFAQLRRWTLATIAAAETAADFAAILKTSTPPDGEAAAADPFDEVEIARRMMMTLPAGWDMTQFKAEHPTSTYSDFKRELLGEIARCMSMPYNVAAGNSSSYNYASGRLDWQTYFRALKVERQRMRAQVLDRIFRAWAREAVLIEGLLPQTLRRIGADWSHEWMWDGTEHVDPQKEANAQGTRLANLCSTHAEEWAKQGKDWEEQAEQIAREVAKFRALGLRHPADASMPAAAPAKPAEDEPEPEDEEEDADDEDAKAMARAKAEALSGLARAAERFSKGSVE